MPTSDLARRRAVAIAQTIQTDGNLTCIPTPGDPILPEDVPHRVASAGLDLLRALAEARETISRLRGELERKQSANGSLAERLDRLASYCAQSHHWGWRLDVFAWRDVQETIALLRGEGNAE